MSSLNLYSIGSNNSACINCTAYSSNQSSVGFTASTNDALFVNCIGWNTSQNYSLTLLPAIVAINCASGGGAVADVFGNRTNFITLTADPFTSAAGGDFSLNSTAGGGALLRALGYPSSFPGVSTSSYRDVGAAQHQDGTVGRGGILLKTFPGLTRG